MFYVGCHLSSSGGFLKMGETALKLNANTFQFFLRNPRGGAAKDIDDKDVKAFIDLARKNNFGKIISLSIITSVKFSHSKKAIEPITDIDCDIVTLSIVRLFLKAPTWISVTGKL